MPKISKNTRSEPRMKTISEERKMMSTYVHTGTWYLALRVIPGTVCSKESTAQRSTVHHRTTRQCTAPNGAALRAAEQ